MESIYEKISISAASLTLGLIMVSTTVELVKVDFDPNGCSISPDNAGCVLNRPIDQQRRAELGITEESEIEELKAFASEEEDLELPGNLDIQLQEDSIDEQ
ncbi:hypothetical protein [Roseofilum sp. Guam]|uniref:hypothetical protein n=1 Tax=Roseofilum sp. Guam TaxID=2821502 RepID=UPI001B18073F|nr:hypothetical protein [Roseofilum sp. Guam]MBP0029451.1 hypothetical protein [Roseofilum sp. Guam]